MIEVKEKFLLKYKFIDLFAGIGGFHYALSSFGAECVFASEWDEAAQYTYAQNFAMTPAGDITKIDEKEIPAHDIICGGFPCQAFSISGKRRGFEDARGTLFFDIARIAALHKPKVLFLENVKNLMTHDGGKTFGTIKSILESLGYDVFTKVLDTSDFGLPQHRERLYFVCFRNDIKNRAEFKFPVGDKKSSLSDILEDKPENAKVIERNDIVFSKEFVPEKDENGKILIPNRPIQIGYVNKGGQGERIYHPLGHAVTLSAYGGGAGAKTGMYKINKTVRKLSPRECARLQGFPDEFKPHPKNNQAYKQFGNSVSINVLQHIVIEISKILDRKA